MPWTGKQFAERHHHGLSKPAADKAASMANAMLRSGTPEGEAIATANKYANKHFALGGFADGGFTPEPSPTERASLYGLEYGSRYNPNIIQDRLPTPAAVPGTVMPGATIAGISAAPGLTQQNVLGQAMHSLPYGARMAKGGDAGKLKDGVDGGHHPGGYIASDVPGRTDRLPMTVDADSFVFPADIVSALGQGNSDAGAKMLDGVLGPKAIGRAKGGDVPKSDVIVAGGEYTATPDQLRHIGKKMRKTGKSRARSDLSAGHQWAQDFVAKVRKHQINWLRSAPKPKK